MKKNYFVSMMLILTMMLSTLMVYAQPSDLLVHYKLDDGSGTVALDESGNGFDGEVVGAEGWIAEGEIDGAFEFDGSTNITLPTDVMNMTSNLGSVAFWMKADAPSGINTIWSAGDNTTGGGFGAENEMHIHLEQEQQDIWAGGEISFFAIADPNLFLFSDPEKGGSPGVPPVNPTVLTNMEWRHVAAVWENNEYAALYIDGESIWDTTIYYGTDYELSHMFLGQMLGGGRTYTGALDDVRIYNSALSADDVSDLYNKVEPPETVYQLKTDDINLSVFPNPASSDATVRFSTDAGKKVSVNLFNVTGSLIGNVNEGISVAGKNIVYLNTTGYKPGVYFVEVQIDSKVAYTKMVIQ